MRLDAGQRGVQRQLSYGDTHALSTQVTQAEYPLAVRDDDRPHVLLGPVLQDLVDVALVVDAYEEASRPAIHQAELLTRLTHGRRVHQRHHAGYIL